MGGASRVAERITSITPSLHALLTHINAPRVVVGILTDRNKRGFIMKRLVMIAVLAHKYLAKSCNGENGKNNLVIQPERKQ